MYVKENEATVNRPAGKRPLDASNILADLNHYIKAIKAEDAWKNSDRNSITIFKSSGLTIVLSGLHQSAVIDDYGRGGVTVLQVLTGKVSFTSDGEEQEAGQGQVIITHRDGNYFVKALEDTFLLLTLKDA